MAPKSPRESARMTRDIREAVQQELEFDPQVDAAGISVKNMSGNVTLNGTVPSYPQYQEAAAAAKRVKGVTKVHNHLMVDLPLSDYRDDPMLTTAANNAIALAVRVPSTVEASATDGDVWLTGRVGYRFQRDAADRAVAGLTGVRRIVNDVEVFSYMEAAEVTKLVQGALDRYALIDDTSEIEVDASEGTVTLTGHVATWAEHDMVINAASMGTGVKSVRDDLIVIG